MDKEELFSKFIEMYPEWSRGAISYKKIGSKTLAITFDSNLVPDCGVLMRDGRCSRVFLYNNPSDWQFGTKLWRRRPRHLDKKEEIKNEK